MCWTTTEFFVFFINRCCIGKLLSFRLHWLNNLSSVLVALFNEARCPTRLYKKKVACNQPSPLRLAHKSRWHVLPWLCLYAQSVPYLFNIQLVILNWTLQYEDNRIMHFLFETQFSINFVLLFHIKKKRENWKEYNVVSYRYAIIKLIVLNVTQKKYLNFWKI